MNRTDSPAFPRWALLVLMAAPLALGGCGRKGGLDLPPHASAQPTAANEPSVDTDAAAAASRGTVFDPSYGTERPPTAAKGTKKSFILDPLLGN